MNMKLSHSRKLIWIDLDNSPHVPFFQPIIRELGARGYDVFLTARDCFQVCGLADLFELSYKKVGRHYGKNKAMKVLGSVVRSLRLLPTILSIRPSFALSHGSRSQLLVARMLGIPSILILDYEFAQSLLAIHPTLAIMPDVIPTVPGNSCVTDIATYPGIKEDVYVPDFKPDPSTRRKVGVSESEILVTIRPPATEAHYHNPASEALLAAVINDLRQNENVRMLMLPRNDRQDEFIRAQWPDLMNSGKIVIPDQVLDGLNLMWYSDLVISGGGTMNREAAALRVPVYSIFRGRIGAVDKYLARPGGLCSWKRPMMYIRRSTCRNVKFPRGFRIIRARPL